MHPNDQKPPRSRRRRQLTLLAPIVQQSILRKQLERDPLWHVEVNGFGVHVLRDARGADPLKHPDPLVQLHNVHLAASAPTLKQAVLALVKRLETIHGGWKRDDELVVLAWTAIYGTTPPQSDIVTLHKEGGQLQIDLDEAA